MMVADPAIQELAAVAAITGFAAEAPRHWDVLGRLEKTAVGKRGPDGAVSVRRGEPAGCFLYGPYLHLPRGHYRLTFRCRPGAPTDIKAPVAFSGTASSSRA